MRALVVTPGLADRAALVERPEPPAAEGEVLVEMVAVGVCGTDKDIVQFTYGTPPPGSDHLIVGHECLGEVVEVGEAVRGFQPGDLVVPRVRRPCPHATCPACRHGHPDFCITGDYTERGIKELHGYACPCVAVLPVTGGNPDYLAWIAAESGG